MFKKVSLALAILATFLGQSPVAAGSDKRKEVVIALAETATVADFFTTLVDGKPTFSLPNTPQLRAFYLQFRQDQYSAEYTTQAGTITLGAFVRFIDQGHDLFKDKEEKNNYSKALYRAIQAYWQWAVPTNRFIKRNTVEEWNAVLAAQEEVYAHLKQLPLSNPTTKAALEKILSTPTSWTPISNFFNSLCAPYRSKIENDAITGKPMIKLPRLGAFQTTAIYLTGALIAAGIITLSPKNSLPQYAGIAGAASGILMTVLTFMPNIRNTRTNLSPEPGKGIKVVIELEPSQATT